MQTIKRLGDGQIQTILAGFSEKSGVPAEIWRKRRPTKTIPSTFREMQGGFENWSEDWWQEWRKMGGRKWGESGWYQGQLWRAWEITFRGPVFSPEGNWKPWKDFKEEKRWLDFHPGSIPLAQCGRWIEKESKVAVLELAEPSVLLWDTRPLFTKLNQIRNLTHTIQTMMGSSRLLL